MEQADQRDEAGIIQAPKDEGAHGGHHSASAREPHSDRPRLLVVGTETAVFSPDSPVRRRILAYTEAFEHTDIIVMCGPGFEKEHVNDRVTLYPTNSASRFMRVWHAIKIGRDLSKADIVTVQDPFETGLAGLLIARTMGARLHVQVHTDFLSPAYTRLSLMNRLRYLIAGFVLRRASRVRVVSERVRSSIQKKYNLTTSMTVLPIFVDVAKFQNAQPLDNLTDDRITNSTYKLLVVSREAPEKNIRLAVESFKKVAPHNACLILIGDINLDDISVRDRIFGMGRWDPERFYKSVDLVLVPSHYEGYGLVIIEALAAGKPVLSTDVGIAREAGAIITDEAHFADALKQWFESGPREMHLKNYPYSSFDDYVRQYCADIIATPT